MEEVQKQINEQRLAKAAKMAAEKATEPIKKLVEPQLKVFIQFVQIF